MAIIPTWSSFRQQFAETVSLLNTSIAFTAPDRVDAGVTDLVTAGFLVGHRLIPSGSGVVAANLGPFIIASFPTNAIAETVEQTITTQGAASPRSLEAAFIDPDGLERWPVANVNSTWVNTFEFFADSGPFVPLVGFGDYIVTVNAVAADAVQGTDEYAWFLSQRTEDTAQQSLTIEDTPDAAGQSFSGTIRLRHTQLALDEYGLTEGVALTPTQTAAMFKNVHVYIQRLSDDAIQFVDLHRFLGTN